MLSPHKAYSAFLVEVKVREEGDPFFQPYNYTINVKFKNSNNIRLTTLFKNDMYITNRNLGGGGL